MLSQGRVNMMQERSPPSSPGSRNDRRRSSLSSLSSTPTFSPIHSSSPQPLRRAVDAPTDVASPLPHRKAPSCTRAASPMRSPSINRRSAVPSSNTPSCSSPVPQKKALYPRVGSPVLSPPAHRRAIASPASLANHRRAITRVGATASPSITHRWASSSSNGSAHSPCVLSPAIHRAPPATQSPQLSRSPRAIRRPSVATLQIVSPPQEAVGHIALPTDSPATSSISRREICPPSVSVADTSPSLNSCIVPKTAEHSDSIPRRSIASFQEITPPSDFLKDSYATTLRDAHLRSSSTIPALLLDPPVEDKGELDGTSHHAARAEKQDESPLVSPPASPATTWKRGLSSREVSMSPKLMMKDYVLKALASASPQVAPASHSPRKVRSRSLATSSPLVCRKLSDPVPVQYNHLKRRTSLLGTNDSISMPYNITHTTHIDGRALGKLIRGNSVQLLASNNIPKYEKFGHLYKIGSNLDKLTKRYFVCSKLKLFFYKEKESKKHYKEFDLCDFQFQRDPNTPDIPIFATINVAPHGPAGSTDNLASGSGRANIGSNLDRFNASLNGSGGLSKSDNAANSRQLLNRFNTTNVLSRSDDTKVTNNSVASKASNKIINRLNTSINLNLNGTSSTDSRDNNKTDLPFTMRLYHKPSKKLYKLCAANAVEYGEWVRVLLGSGVVDKDLVVLEKDTKDTEKKQEAARKAKAMKKMEDDYVKSRLKQRLSFKLSNKNMSLPLIETCLCVLTVHKGEADLDKAKLQIGVTFDDQSWTLFRKYEKIVKFYNVVSKLKFVNIKLPSRKAPRGVPLEEFLETQQVDYQQIFDLVTRNRPHVFALSGGKQAFLRFIAPVEWDDIKPEGFVMPFQII